MTPNDTTTGKRRLHRRHYEVESYLEDEAHLRIVGELRDVKPDGMWAHGDTEPLTIHHMRVELVVEISTLKIVDTSVEMVVHPQRECPNILPAYRELIGLSIARGFTHKVREMYGGPKACTHIAALLNAMAPVAVQSLFGVDEALGRKRGVSATGERRNPSFEINRNTCHVWSDDGPMFARVARGETPPIPMTMTKRLRDLGVDPDVAMGRDLASDGTDR